MSNHPLCDGPDHPCKKPATMFVVLSSSDDGHMVCGECADPYLLTRESGALHHGWRALVMGVGGDPDPNGEEPPKWETYTLVEFGDGDEWMVVVDGMGSMRSQSSRAAVHNHVDLCDCEAIEVLEPGQPSREEIVQFERARCVSDVLELIAEAHDEGSKDGVEYLRAALKNIDPTHPIGEGDETT